MGMNHLLHREKLCLPISYPPRCALCLFADVKELLSQFSEEMVPYVVVDSASLWEEVSPEHLPRAPPLTPDFGGCTGALRMMSSFLGNCD